MTITVKEFIEQLKQFDENDEIYFAVNTDDLDYGEKVECNALSIWKYENQKEIIIEYTF